MTKVLIEKRIVKYGLELFLIVMITLFIFSNSLAGYDQSHHTSDSVSQIILPNEYSDNEDILLIVRKIAHLIEYALLGIAVTVLLKCIEKDFQRKTYSVVLFYTLFVAVLDEHIQSFSDRTSSTADILLDFAGAIIGMVLVFGAVGLFRFFKRAKKRQQ